MQATKNIYKQPFPPSKQHKLSMISPKYSTTHYFHSIKTLSAEAVAPNIINVFLDYNCPFSAKLFTKLRSTVIPQLQQKYPSKFQFVYVNVVQPWHPNSLYLNEFSVVAAQLIRAKQQSPESNQTFWDLSNAIFENKEQFYDSANADYTRNQIYSQIYQVVAKNLQLPFGEEEILSQLRIQQVPLLDEQSNSGNAATVDVKYFTRYLRGVGVHMTPSVSVNGITDDSVSSGSEPDELISKFETYLS